MLRTLLPVLVLTFGCAPKHPTSPAADIEALAPAEPIPFNPEIRSGVLDNGMRYYIAPNETPERRAVFRLVVEVGSIVEDPDQLGLAHFVEHMAFNGTTHFEGNDLIKYLERTGTRFGAHLNAHTSFDETVYKLQVPTDDAEIFDQAFLILEDWAHGISFDPEETEAERGVVLEEWRRSLGPGSRAREVTFPVAWAGSPYPDRMPIGVEESLKSFTHEAAVRYYEDWYRPDLMAIIAVGDFEPDEVEHKIREHFGRIEAPENPRERVRHDIPDRTEPAWVTFADPEFTSTYLRIESGHDFVLDGTFQEYRQNFVLSAFVEIVNERLDEVSRSADAPFRSARIWHGRRSPTEGAWTMQIQPVEGQTLAAYERGLQELERIRRHGVLSSELERAVARMERQMESHYNQRDTTDSVRFAEELVRHVTTGEAVPGVVAEWELAQRYLPTITTEEIAEVARTEFLPPEQRVVSLLQPERDDLPVPSEEALQAVEARVAEAQLAPHVEGALDQPLVADLPDPGEIIDEREEEAVGFTVWTLSNGAEVWLKPTDFDADQLLFQAHSIGGINQIPEADYVAATSAGSILRRSGLGEFSASDLEKRLSGHQVNLTPYFSATAEGLRGSASTSDLELLLQLNWLAFTAPRFDEQAFDRLRRENREDVANRLSNPRQIFHDTYTEILWQDFPLYRPWTDEHIEQMDLARSEAFVRDRFADASDFRFTFVGDFDPETLRDLATRYLATLPALDRQDERVDLGARRFTGPHSETVHSGREPQAEVLIHLHGPLNATFEDRNRLSALNEVLSTRLREVLREDLGGVYGVSVFLRPHAWPEALYDGTISFTCEPERVEELEQAAFAVLEDLRTQTVDPHYIDAFKNKSLRSREEQEQRNAFWVSIPGPTLDLLQWTDEPLSKLMDYEARVNAMTPELLQQTAQEVLSTDNILIVRRLPADTSEDPAQ